MLEARGIVPLRFIVFTPRLCRLLMIGTAPFIHKKEEKMKEKILVSYHLLKEGFEELEQAYDVIFPEKERFSRDEIKQMSTECVALLSNIDLTVDKEIIDVLQGHVKIISNYGVGYNNVDADYARQKGITVANTPDPVVEPTAELAYALMGCAARRLAEDDRKLRNGTLKWGTLEHLGTGMYGKTLGIVGMGRIGQAIARRALAGGMNIIYHNRHQLSAEYEQRYHASFRTLEELMAQSDFVALSMPLNAETHHLIDAPAISLMKADAILVNTARGAVVDEQALTEALQNRQIRGAALDVFENEPLITAELYNLDNVVLSPHCGTSTIDARVEMSRFAARNIINFLKGEGPVARVN